MESLTILSDTPRYRYNSRRLIAILSISMLLFPSIYAYGSLYSDENFYDNDYVMLIQSADNSVDDTTTRMDSNDDSSGDEEGTDDDSITEEEEVNPDSSSIVTHQEKESKTSKIFKTLSKLAKKLQPNVLEVDGEISPYFQNIHFKIGYYKDAPADDKN